MKTPDFYISSFLAMLLVLIGVGSMSASGSNTEGTNPAGSTTNAEDQFLLGRAYDHGEGVSQSYEQAGIWYRKAADQGNLKAMNNLGLLFLEGNGIKKDPSEAYRWFRMAAEKGDSHSQFFCGKLLCEGNGVKKNAKEGVELIKKSADQGFLPAMERLAQIYYLGEDGVTADRNLALEMIRSAAAKDSPWACGTLGRIYSHGLLVKQDNEMANKWLLKGMELHDLASLREYGLLLMKKDKFKAYPYMKLSYDLGEMHSLDEKLACLMVMTPEQTVAGDQESENIHQKYYPDCKKFMDTVKDPLNTNPILPMVH